MPSPLLVAATLSDTNLAALPAPSMALLFHTSGSSLSLVTAHEVIHDAYGSAHIGPGRVALPSDERRLADILASRSRRTRIDLVPENLLHSEADALAWWMPPTQREMLVKDKQGVAHALSVVWPSLVALVVRRKLYIVALDGTARPACDSAVYHPPLANVYEDGSVCTGSAALPHGQAIADLPGWRAVIEATYWSHDNTTKVLAAPKAHKGKRPTTDNYRAAEFWKGRSGTNIPVREADLVPLGMNLTAWMESIIDGEVSR